LIGEIPEYENTFHAEEKRSKTINMWFIEHAFTHYLNGSQNEVKATEYHDFVVKRIDNNYEKYGPLYFDQINLQQIFVKLNKFTIDKSPDI
jgi:hypothetical protein